MPTLRSLRWPRRTHCQKMTTSAPIRSAGCRAGLEWAVRFVFCSSLVGHACRNAAVLTTSDLGARAAGLLDVAGQSAIFCSRPTRGCGR